MLPTKQLYQSYHEATNHSPLSVQLDPNYVDASTQPTAYKKYPHFYRRYPLKADLPAHEFIKLTSAITLERTYKTYTAQLRVNPSAGGLYPTEVYVQMREISGIIDGIYHFEPNDSSLTLIYELIDDGLEAYICPGKTVSGFIFLVSCIYFRSSWKYKNRSLRYCFLDSGHHLGAIEAAAWVYHHPIQFNFEFDKLGLNEDLGFENKEFVTACAIAGNFVEKSRRRLRLSVPFVSGTDYFEPNLFIENAYRETLNLQSDRQPLCYPQFEGDRERYRQIIWERRSARGFQKGEITQTEFEEIAQIIGQPIATETKEDLDVYYLINRVSGIEPGLYRGSELIKTGDYTAKGQELCINQRLGGDSAVTLFIASAYQNYQTATQLAGLLGQRIYLASRYRNTSCSGIGAYYDQETQDFLGTDKAVLYTMAIGR